MGVASRVVGLEGLGVGVEGSGVQCPETRCGI